MSNLIPKSSFFYTPQSIDEFNERIRMLPSDDQAIVYQYVMEAFNLSHKLIEDANNQ